MRFIEVFEIEEELEPASTSIAYHNKVWRTPKNTISPPPLQIQPPSGYAFASDWKIDVSNKTLDTQGWKEYTEEPESNLASIAPGIRKKRKRRRRWLRSIQPIASDVSLVSEDKTNQTTSETAVMYSSSTAFKKKKKASSTKVNIVTHTMHAIENDFRFKGFGWSFYKSIIFREAWGIGLRIPLSLNFDSLERRPYLPSITSVSLRC